MDIPGPFAAFIIVPLPRMLYFFYTTMHIRGVWFTMDSIQIAEDRKGADF